MLTPESLTAAISEQLAQEGAAEYKHPSLTLEPGEPQLGLLIHTSDGRGLMVPYVRLAAAIQDGVRIIAAFGDFEIEVSRPQQPPDASGDESDKDGARLLAILLVGLQDQVLRGMRGVPDQLDLTFKKVERKGGGGGKRGGG